GGFDLNRETHWPVWPEAIASSLSVPTSGNRLPHSSIDASALTTEPVAGTLHTWLTRPLGRPSRPSRRAGGNELTHEILTVCDVCGAQNSFREVEDEWLCENCNSLALPEQVIQLVNARNEKSGSG